MGSLQALGNTLLAARRNGKKRDIEIGLIFARHNDSRAGRERLLLRQTPQALTQGGGNYAAAVRILDILLRDAGIAAGIRLLVDNLEGVELDTMVRHILEQGLLETRRNVALLGLGIHGRRNVGELGPNACLHGINVKVAHNYNRLKVRTVPLMIEVQDLLTFEAVDDLQRTQHPAPGLLGPLVDKVVLQHHHTVARVVAQAPLLAYHSPFVVQSLLLAGNVAGPVVQHQQHRIYEGIAHQRHGGNIVDGLRLGRIGVHIVAEAHAVLCQKLQQPLGGIMPGAVERHMLQEMRKSVLVVFFLKGAHVVRNIEIRTAGRVLVMIEIIRHSVVQPSHPEIGVGGNGLGEGAGGQAKRRQQGEKLLHTDLE